MASEKEQQPNQGGVGVQVDNDVQGESSNTQFVNECGTIGTLSEYKIDGDWTVCQKRTEQYFLANMTPEDRKVPLLITCMGEPAYKASKDYCDPVLSGVKE